MRRVRWLLAAPFMLVALIAYAVMGFQLILAIANVLSGLSLADAVTRWVINTVVLAVIGTVAAGIGLFIGGDSITDR